MLGATGAHPLNGNKAMKALSVNVFQLYTSMQYGLSGYFFIIRTWRLELFHI
jgi:hypothetical protein